MSKRGKLAKCIRKITRCCEICGLEDPQANLLHSHHIKQICEGGVDSEKNIAVLCPNCHAKVHSNLYYNLEKYFTSGGKWVLFFEGEERERRMPS